MKKLFKKIIERELGYHPVLLYPLFVLKVFYFRLRYKKLLARIRGKKSRVKVAFLAAATAKWKCQSFYNEMQNSDRFDPVVISKREDSEFYLSKGCKVVSEPLVAVGADIVIYQDPWDQSSMDNPVTRVAKSSLCCYIPYSIESIADSSRSERFDYHHLANFHSLMFACFQWSPDYARHYWSVQHSWEWAGSVLGFGHPTLDVFSGKAIENGSLVIYAPHFSFQGGNAMGITDIGTFHWSGKAVLTYAKAHPEIKWAFKPHPKLRACLVENGHMTYAEVNDYYADWERIGLACYDGNYAELFLSSRAMITDSNSFLLEYMAVGKPLIHLIPKDCKMRACPQAQAIFDTFYEVRDEGEMLKVFKEVIENRNDPNGERRRYESEKACVLENHAGKKIVEWLELQCG